MKKKHQAGQVVLLPGGRLKRAFLVAWQWELNRQRRLKPTSGVPQASFLLKGLLRQDGWQMIVAGDQIAVHPVGRRQPLIVISSAKAIAQALSPVERQV